MPGVGTSSSQTQTTQNTNTQGSSNPWLPTVQPLTDITAALSGGIPNYIPTPAEQNALAGLQETAAALPNYTDPAKSLIAQLMNGGAVGGAVPGATGGAGGGSGGNTDLQNKIATQYNAYQEQLAPFLDPSYLDPTNVPGIQKALEVVRNDAANNTNALFAGAGRDLSGDNSMALGRGIAQAEAPILLGQYNTNVGVQRGAQDAAINNTLQTGGVENSLQQGQLSNILQGLGLTSTLGGLNTGANAMLQAGQAARGLPLNNLGQIEQLLLPIAGLGKQFQQQSQGTGTSNTTSTASPLSDILGGVKILGGLGLV